MLASRWNQLCDKAGLDGRAGWSAIATAYGEETRAYHNLRHLADCLDRPALFTHAEFQQRFGTQARANLSWEIGELDASLPLTPGQSPPAIQ